MGKSMKIAALMTALTTCAALGLSPLGAANAWAQDSTAENDRAIALMATDPAGARAILEPLAAAGDAEAMNNLAVLIGNDGPDWSGDPLRAEALQEAAIKGGSKVAALNVALRLLTDPQGDHARAIILLKMADTNGKLKTATAYPWGRAYLFGWGVERDLARGVAYLEQADAGGSFASDIHFLLGRAYDNGWGVTPDPVRAYTHMRASADDGDERAQWQTGMMLLQGDGVAADAVEAYRYVTMSAENGHIDGMNSRAVMLALGQGVEKDPAAAREWYAAAADQRSAHAMRALGGMYLTGEGGEQAPALGIAMLELAAEAGDPQAPKALAMATDLRAELRTAIDAAKAEWIARVGKPDPAR